LLHGLSFRGFAAPEGFFWGETMSIDKKSVHVRLTPEMHERLALIAGLKSDDISEHAGYLLEKMIVAEYHAVTVQASRLKRLGLIGSEGDCQGGTGK